MGGVRTQRECLLVFSLTALEPTLRDLSSPSTTEKPSEKTDTLKKGSLIIYSSELVLVVLGCFDVTLMLKTFFYKIKE